MKIYAVIHGVCGIWEGYSETDCEFFSSHEAATKHAKQLVQCFEDDDMTMQIDHPQDDLWYYHQDRDGSGDIEDATQCVITIITLDNPYRRDTTEHVWLVWDQLENETWDYYPLCMSLVARVSSDVMDNTGKGTCHETNMYQLTEFISSVYYRNEVFIDVDDYVLHAFRIPKKLETRCNECGYVDDAVASHYEECSKLKTDDE